MSRLLYHRSSASRRVHPRHVFLDLFGTLIYPTLPVHLRYNQIAQSNGFGDFQLTADHFKAAFKKINREFPNYGKNSWLFINSCSQEKNVRMSPKDWWLKVIRATFENSLNPQEPNSALARTREIEEVSELVYEAFLTNEDGRIYSNYEDTSDFIKYLVREEIDFSILTNSDPKIMNALPRSLEELLTGTVDEDPASGPSRRSKIFTSWDLGVTKPDKQVWASVISMLGLSQASHRLIHIGDDFEEDFLGAKSAGLAAVWLDREDNLRRISKAIENNAKGQHYQFMEHERVCSLNELIGWL